jgi:hypothetical protein
METLKHKHAIHVHPSNSNNRTPQYVPNAKQSTFRLAISATLHCLIGCGIGEVLGMIISSFLGLTNLSTIILSIVLGFFGGLLLGVLPLRKIGFSYKKAMKTVLAGEGLSIIVMEAFEIFTQVTMPGVMDAHLTESVFWTGMFVSLAAGFIAALPVNYIMVKRGIRHMH